MLCLAVIYILYNMKCFTSSLPSFYNLRTILVCTLLELNDNPFMNVLHNWVVPGDTFKTFLMTSVVLLDYLCRSSFQSLKQEY